MTPNDGPLHSEGQNDQMTVHGVAVSLFGVGALITGDSGVGKSECALDLLRRGHQLVADDAVIIVRKGDVLTAEAPELTFELLEIRGLGIVNVRQLFGPEAVAKKTAVDICIELKPWHSHEAVDRLGLEQLSVHLLGVDVAKYVLAVAGGRNTATLVETAVRVHLLRLRGENAAEKLITEHAKLLE